MAAVTAGGSSAQSLHNGAQPRAQRKQKGASSFPDVFPGVRAPLCGGQWWMQLAEKGVPVPGDPPAVCPSLARVAHHGCAGRVAGGIIWSRSESLGLALLSKLKAIAALCKAFTCAKNLSYNASLCY